MILSFQSLHKCECSNGTGSSRKNAIVWPACSLYSVTLWVVPIGPSGVQAVQLHYMHNKYSADIISCHDAACNCWHGWWGFLQGACPSLVLLKENLTPISLHIIAGFLTPIWMSVMIWALAYVRVSVSSSFFLLSLDRPQRETTAASPSWLDDMCLG